MTDYENDAPKKKKIQKPLRFFVSNLKSKIGHALVDIIKHDPDVDPLSPHLILGSANERQNESLLAMGQQPLGVPEGVRKVLDVQKVSLLQRILIDSDVVIYDLNTCNLEEAEFAIKTLKMANFKEEKFLICISSVMVWSNTTPKEKKEGDEQEENPEEAEEPDSEAEVDENAEEKNAEEETEEVVKKHYIRFSESDFTCRKPLPKYEALKYVETLCMSASLSKPNLKSYVLCAGIQYGQGEDFFYNIFKQAWLQHPQQLSYFGNGRNRIPTIHVKDLAQFTRKIIDKPPKKVQYIFAIDHNKKPTQKNIIEAISRNIGTGLASSMPIPINYLQMHNNLDIQLLDVRLKPSKVFEPTEEEGEAQQQNEEEEEPIAGGFKWECQEGMQKNIQKINSEFNSYQTLHANKILIQGPPASGKTFFGEQLAALYNVPHIKIKDLVDEALELQTEFGEELRTALTEVREKMTEDAQAELDKLKEKKEKLGTPMLPEEQEVDQTKILPRLPDEFIYKIFQKRLGQNDCINRGYVLDGYPKTYDNAKGLFLMVDQTKEDAGEEGALILNTKTVPNSIVYLTANDDFLNVQTRNLPEKVTKNTHWNEEGMKKRLKQYRKDHNLASGQLTDWHFYQENNLNICTIDLQQPNIDAYMQIRSFIERNGAFRNFQILECKKEEQRLIQEQSHIQDLNEGTKSEVEHINVKENEMRELVEEEYKLKNQDIQEKQKKILDFQSAPLRDYMENNVIQFVTDGLLELMKDKQDDPVDFMAEYLFKRSLEVKHPDPKKYLEFANCKK